MVSLPYTLAYFARCSVAGRRRQTERRPFHLCDSVIKSAVFFDFVGNTANTVAFYDLRFDNYLPQCR